MRTFIAAILFFLTHTLFAQSDHATFVADIRTHRETLNAEFKNPSTSPLKGKALRKFKSLPFYEPDSLYRVTATLVLQPNSPFVAMKTTTARVSEERIYALAEFTLMGRNFSVPVYQSKELMSTKEYADYLFFPFTDLTNGDETYGGGRYIDLRIPTEGTEIVIDFNKAYNPTCAYNPAYSCPIVPKENWLNVEVRAGVKYDGH